MPIKKCWNWILVRHQIGFALLSIHPRPSFAIVNFHSAACFVWMDIRHLYRDCSLSSKQYARYSPSDVPTRRYFRYSIANVYTPWQTLPLSTRPHVGMNYTRSGIPVSAWHPSPHPLRALLIPRCTLFPCTQNALLRDGCTNYWHNKRLQIILKGS